MGCGGCCALLFKARSMKLLVAVPKDQFDPFETVKVSINFGKDSNSYKTITAITMKLIMQIEVQSLNNEVLEQLKTTVYSSTK